MKVNQETVRRMDESSYFSKLCFGVVSATELIFLLNFFRNDTTQRSASI